MSTLLVEVCKVKEVLPHNNADKLEKILVKGWEVVVQKGVVKVGDLVVYIPPDTILPESLHTHLGITKYCAELPKHYEQSLIVESDDGATQADIMHCLYENTDPQTVVRPTARRVKAARLRGEASYGTIMTKQSFVDYIIDNNLMPHCDDVREIYEYVEEGTNVAQILSVGKWEPPIKSTQGDVVKDHPEFHKYTNIENWRNYPDVFTPDDVVIVSEKINGTNSRLAFLSNDDIESKEENPYIFAAGSHNTRRKNSPECLYWKPFALYPQIKLMLFELWDQHDKKPVILFGEIYGKGVQDMWYDSTDGINFRAFDISIGGKYVDYTKYKIFKKYKIPHVPILYTGPYSKEIISGLTNGTTELGSEQKFSGREGVVITHSLEEHDPIIGRKILKSVSVDYLDRKNQKEGH